MPSTNRNRGKKGRGKRKAPVHEHHKAGLVMPVRRVRKNMRDGRYAPRLTKTAPG